MLCGISIFHMRDFSDIVMCSIPTCVVTCIGYVHVSIDCTFICGALYVFVLYMYVVLFGHWCPTNIFQYTFPITFQY